MIKEILLPAKYSILLLILFFINTSFVFCQIKQYYSEKYSLNLEEKNYQNYWINLNTKTQGTGKSGDYFARTDSTTPFGLGIEINLPEKIIGKNFQLIVNGYIRTNKIENKGAYVISLVNKDSTIYWKGININKPISESNKWFEFSDTTLFPGYLPENTRIKAYLWNCDAKTYIDIDDLSFSFYEYKNPSFLSDIDTNIININNFDIDTNIIYKNDYYSFVTDRYNNLYFKDKLNNLLCKPFEYFVNYKLLTDTTKQIFYKNSKFELYEIGVNFFKFICKNKDLSCEMSIYYDDSPEIKIETNTTYIKDIVIQREALIFEFNDEISEIYRKNCQIDCKKLKNEYWLDNEGLKIGEGYRSVYIYHPADISSLQVNTNQKKIVVNLDYYRDHQFLHFPLIEGKKNFFYDISENKFYKNTSTKCGFTINIGIDAGSIPRIMKNPYGYLATFIWTEHADWTDIRTHRALYFGSENIKNPPESVGGFVKNGIPVTKSVFYCNPDSIKNCNASFKSSFKGLICNIKQNDEFKIFLDSLAKYNNEICLHTPEQYTTNRKTLDEALDFMKNNYNSKTWIDHGYDNSLHNNRENIICDGTDSKSEYYALDLWKKFGVKYFWNAFYEDKPVFSKYTYQNTLISPYIGFGDMFPTPVFWKNKSIADDTYSWKTDGVTDNAKGNMWGYLYNSTTFNDLVNHWGVITNHTYPASVNINNGFWIYNKNNEIVIHPELNIALELLKKYKDKGLIYITTIGNFLDYQLALKNIEIKVLSNKKVLIKNNNIFDIKGLSFAVKSKNITIDNIIPNNKKYKEDIIFWFDLKANESKILKYE